MYKYTIGIKVFQTIESVSLSWTSFRTVNERSTSLKYCVPSHGLQVNPDYVDPSRAGRFLFTRFLYIRRFTIVWQTLAANVILRPGFSVKLKEGTPGTGKEMAHRVYLMDCAVFWQIDAKGEMERRIFVARFAKRGRIICSENELIFFDIPCFEIYLSKSLFAVITYMKILIIYSNVL